MRDARFSCHLGWGVCRGGGVSAQGNVCRGVCLGGVPRGVCLGGVPRGVCLGGVQLNRITYRCKNITLPQTSFAGDNDIEMDKQTC